MRKKIKKKEDTSKKKNKIKIIVNILIKNSVLEI